MLAIPAGLRCRIGLRQSATAGHAIAATQFAFLQNRTIAKRGDDANNV